MGKLYGKRKLLKLTRIAFLSLVEIYANTVSGAFSVIANGGAGHKGQDGGRGQDTADSRVEVGSLIPITQLNFPFF